MSNTNATPSSSSTSSEPTQLLSPSSSEEQLCDLAQAAVEEVTHLDLKVFLVHVLAQPEPWEVLTRPVKVNGQATGYRVQFLQSMAMQVRDAYELGEMEKEVVYVATLLHGIEYWLQDRLVGNSKLRDVMATIVRAYLHQLDAQSPAHAQMLRQCMDWGNEDEESIFITWLQQRMQYAVLMLQRMKL